MRAHPDVLAAPSEAARLRKRHVFAVMIGNLIRNACLYTEQRSVIVEVGTNEVRVTDTGSGMSEDDLERAFQPFYRGSRTGPRGHGIGLAIVRRIADRYRWQVTLESALGRGTTATAHFPAAQPLDAALPGPVQVASYLLAEGRFHDRLLAAAAGLASVAAPIGSHPDLVRLVLARYESAATARPPRDDHGWSSG